MNIFETETITRGPGATRKFASKFAANLAEGDIVALIGELGAGKTCFAQGLGWGLGIDRNVYLASPSFTLVKEYSGRVRIYHMDLYRLNSLDEILTLGYEEYIGGDGVVIIEWADKIADFLRGRAADIRRLIPERSHVVNIDIVNENQRRIKIRTGY